MLGFRYYILSPSHTDADNIDRLNSIYENWVQAFTPILEGGGGKLNPDDFFRHDFVGAVFHGKELVGSHLSTIFDLRLKSNRNHHYIRELPAQSLVALEQRGLNKLVSVEYFNVLPDWRRHQKELSWVNVAMSLALKTISHTSSQAMIGMPRIDRKVDEVLSQCGCITITDKIDKMGYPCAVMIHPNEIDQYADSQVQQWTQRLWESRVHAFNPNIFANNQQIETQTFKKSA